MTRKTDQIGTDALWQSDFLICLQESAGSVRDLSQSGALHVSDTAKSIHMQIRRTMLCMKQEVHITVPTLTFATDELLDRGVVGIQTDPLNPNLIRIKTAEPGQKFSLHF